MKKNNSKTVYTSPYLITLIGFFCLVLIFAVIFFNTKNNMITDMKQMNLQTLNHMDDIMQLFDSFAMQIQEDHYLSTLIYTYSDSPSPQHKNKICSYLNEKRISFSYPNSIVLVLDNEMDFVNTGSLVSPDQIRKSDWFIQFLSQNHSRFYSPMVNEYGSTLGQNMDSFLAAYLYQNDISDGSIIFRYHLSVFDEALKEYTRDNTDCLILGRDNQVLYPVVKNEQRLSDLENIQQILSSLKTTHQQVSQSNCKYYIIGYTKKGGWKLITALPIYRILARSLPVFFVATFLFILFYFFLVSLIISERNSRQREYAFLAAQINPHFIYKTLNTIVFLNKRGKSTEVNQATRALEEILRDKLRIDEVLIYDTIEKELEVIRQYITIQQIYYGFQIQLKEIVPTELMLEPIPKNIIQPLVENALFHGILQKENENGENEGGTICVQIERIGEILAIHVQDDGCGMSKQQLAEVFGNHSSKVTNERGRHIGISNIRNRLSYLPRVKYRMEAESVVGKGTKISIYLTFKKLKGEITK